MVKLLSESVQATCCEEPRVVLESRIDQEIRWDQSEDGGKRACMWLQRFFLLARFKAFCLDLTVCCLQNKLHWTYCLVPDSFPPQFLSKSLKVVGKKREFLTDRRKLYLIFSPLFSSSFPDRYTVI